MAMGEFSTQWNNPKARNIHYISSASGLSELSENIRLF